VTGATPPTLLAGIDVGGTFTDIVVFDPDTGTLDVAKAPSTPADQSAGALAGLQLLLDDLGALARLDHGTTVATNAVLERTGARVGLVTTAGFRDVLEIGRTRRMIPSAYDPTFQRPPPLVPRPLRFEVAGRLDAHGRELEPLDVAALERAARALRRAGVEAVAVCFLHAFANPEHEQAALAKLRQRLPGVPITASSQVIPEFREYERFSTTVINAFLMPVMQRYMAALADKLRARGYAGTLQTMSCVGGTMDIDGVRALPVRTILSGPAAGVAGALWVGSAAGVRRFVTCDMGGTSTDVCLVDDATPAMVTEVAFEGYPIKGRQVDIHTVGAGGGSIALVESAGILRVGPRSAGAEPGPACYGRGGAQATVTDANAVLGRLGARPLGNSIAADTGLARQAVERLGRALGVGSVTRMAEGIVEIAVAQMASAIREITVERGHDPADFVLLAFGGAGPMHAAEVARELGMREVLIPVFPGNLSALGLLASDQVYEQVCTFLQRLSALDVGALQAQLAAHEAAGRTRLAARGFGNRQMRFRHALDMRYARQAFEITVDLPGARPGREALRTRFLDTYERLYGHADADGEIEIVNLRTAQIGITRKPQAHALRVPTGTLAQARVARRDMVVDGRALPAGVYARERLPADARFEGPALIEEAGATTVVTPGWQASVDGIGNLRLTDTA